MLLNVYFKAFAVSCAFAALFVAVEYVFATSIR
jgi:hypothetical protein